MTNTELFLNMLAEASTKEISTATNPTIFAASKKVAKQGGNVATMNYFFTATCQLKLSSNKVSNLAYPP